MRDGTVHLYSRALQLCIRLCVVLQAEGRRNDSGPASPSGRGQERQLRVHGHSKLVKEFTDLCIVQELNAHNGESHVCLPTFPASQ